MIKIMLEHLPLIVGSLVMFSGPYSNEIGIVVNLYVYDNNHYVDILWSKKSSIESMFLVNHFCWCKQTLLYAGEMNVQLEYRTGHAHHVLLANFNLF